uniref:Uncharacterized protein n=1 Tax=Aegilops tauschii subsp. strangulata TaxID=200361 RepID=A0A453LDE7_AEGTS
SSLLEPPSLASPTRSSSLLSPFPCVRASRPNPPPPAPAMARPQQEAIDTFISITGADEAVAIRKLEEHAGDLNQAVNAHFTEGDSTV